MLSVYYIQSSNTYLLQFYAKLWYALLMVCCEICMLWDLHAMLWSIEMRRIGSSLSTQKNVYGQRVWVISKGHFGNAKVTGRQHSWFVAALFFMRDIGSFHII